MSYSGIYAESLAAYQNGQNIANAIQKKVDNVAENEVLFGSVDYSGGYENIINDFKNTAAQAADESQDTEGSDGASGADDSAESAGDVVFGANNECTDGKDDGKIGILEGIGSFFKGIGKAVVNTVTSIVTDPGKLLLTAGAVAVGIIFPPAGVAMAVGAGIAGAVQVGKGIYGVATAETDAEAKAACENMGAGTLQVGLSVVGAKAGLKAMKGTSGSAMNALSKSAKSGVKPTFTQKAGAFMKDTVTGGRGASYDGLGSIGKAWTNAADDAGGYLLTKGVSKLSGNISDKGFIKGTGETLSSAKNAYKEAKVQRQANKEVAKHNKEMSKYQKEIDDLTSKLENKKLSQAAREQLEDQLRIAKNNKTIAEAKYAKYANEISNKMKNATDEFNAAKRKNDLAEKVTQKAKNSGKELSETAKQRIQKVQADYKKAKANFDSETAMSSARETAMKSYSESQTKIAQAQSALDDAKTKLDGLGKKASSEEIKAAQTAVDEAKIALKEAKAQAPDTSALRQGLKAANKKAGEAGYQGKGYTPFLGATMGPLAYQLEEA